MEEKEEEHKVTNIRTPSKVTEVIDHIIGILIKSIKDGRISTIKKIMKIIKAISREDIKVTKILSDLFNNSSKIKRKDSPFGEISRGRDNCMKRKSSNSETQFEDHLCWAYFCLSCLLFFCLLDPVILTTRTRLIK